MPGKLLGYCQCQGTGCYAKVISFKEYNSDVYKRYVDTWAISVEKQCITTLDLLGVLNRLGQRDNTEDSGTWMTGNALDILSKEQYIDLSLLIFKPPREFNAKDHGINSAERKKILYNLTPTDEPYWATPYLYAFFTDSPIMPIIAYKGIDMPDPESTRIEDEFRWIFARPKQGAKERLRKEDLDKVWFTSDLLPNERMKLQDNVFKTVPDIEQYVTPENSILVNDGTELIHEAVDISGIVGKPWEEVRKMRFL